MGLDYIYVNDGNDVQALIEAFSKVKDIQHPIVVHINTLKGKGYAHAEQDKETYHWRTPSSLLPFPIDRSLLVFILIILQNGQCHFS